jgi:CheY-like chemotaxis protein/HPt (histidine-containing phosphotransfer) domain-containing protein
VARPILVVEDNPVNQQIALRQLASLGYQADVVANGRAAIAAVTNATQPYKLIFMDCQMPEMDGFATTRAIRNLEQATGNCVPIIAMTANAMQGDREMCLAAGMNDHLSKPVQRDMLKQMLEQWLLPTSEPHQPVSEVMTTPKPFQSASEMTPAASGPLDAELLVDLRALRSDKYPNVLARLIDTFYKETLLQITTMRSALERTDATAIRQAAHRLRGASASLGALAMAAHCSELEALAQGNTLTDAFEHIQAIEAEFTRVQQALEVER